MWNNVFYLSTSSQYSLILDIIVMREASLPIYIILCNSLGRWNGGHDQIRKYFQDIDSSRGEQSFAIYFSIDMSSYLLMTRH